MTDNKNITNVQSCKTAVKRSTYADLIAAKQDRVATIAEEIKMFTGLEAKAQPKNIIQLDTIAGLMTYHTSERETVMANVYRFISNYGIKLYSWGLDNAKAERST
jgi:hypothetical protein